MLCLDMKLVSRLRNLSSNGVTTSPPPPSPDSSQRVRDADTVSPLSSDEPEVCSDDDEEAARTSAPAIPDIRIVRDRSRSVCMPVLTSSQLRHLHRRASHHLTCTDSAGRRGVLSRRYYGSVELLPQIEQDGLDGRRFRVENGDSPGEKEEMFGSPSTPVLENPEYQTRWYFKYFLGKLHQNYVAADQEKNPMFLSVVISEGGDQCVPHYRLILWRRSGARKISLPYSSNRSMSVRQILSNYFGIEKLDKAPREVISPEIQKDLLLLEEQEGSVNFKFGVIYAKAGQTSDDEMLSNETGSPEFERFLERLGQRIRLRGWDKYRGGLDVKGDMTGRESVYTVYAGHEVMYHVSTLLPHSKDNPQQLERKRHIGNDIVNIIYSDEPGLLDSFNPNSIRSQFTHVFAVVTSEKPPGGQEDGEAAEAGWRMAIYCDESVPLFGPSLPCPPCFRDAAHFREFLLVKLINGEKASFDTPTFSRKRERTLDCLLRDMYQEHTQDGKSSSMLQRRALSDVVETPGRRREGETRAVEMVRVGQALKLEAIVHGLAPTSLASVGPLKPRPWEPRCIFAEFPHEVVCGDVWADGRLILASEGAGTFVLEDHTSLRTVFDESVQVRQLDVVEQHGILLLRSWGERAKDCHVHVFRLSELERPSGAASPQQETAAAEESGCWGRTQLKSRRLDKTKGAHLYCLSRPSGSHLKMVVAVGRRLSVFQWKHNAAWTAWCASNDTDTVDGFGLLRELQASEPPSLMSIVEAPERDWAVCCALKHQYELHWADASSRGIGLEAAKQAHLVGALDLCEDEEPELLLCYNNTCHFQKLSDECAAPTEFDFSWNSVPVAVACAFPYVIAFTADTMEIRLIVNGNLVHTIAMPNLRLISSKHDVFFASSAPEFSKQARLEQTCHSPSATQQNSAQSAAGPMRIYRIPLQTLSRGASDCSQQQQQQQQRRRATAEVDAPTSPAGAPSSNFLSIVEAAAQHRQLSRSCSSSPTTSLGASISSSSSK